MLEYAATAWDLYNQTNIDTLNRVQKQAVRFCKRDYSHREGSMTRILQELEWLPLETRRKTSRLRMFYKVVNGLVAIPADKFLSLPDRLEDITRSLSKSPIEKISMGIHVRSSTEQSRNGINYQPGVWKAVP